jgi:hypothetical protein
MLAIAVSSCARSDPAVDLDEATPPSTSAPVQMKGAVSPALVGMWKYIVGTYRFNSDGLYVVHYDYMRPGGPGQPEKHVVGDDKGSWTADSEYIYMKSSRGDVIRDSYKLSKDGSKLELYARYIKTPEVLQRQKA